MLLIIFFVLKFQSRIRWTSLVTKVCIVKCIILWKATRVTHFSSRVLPFWEIETVVIKPWHIIILLCKTAVKCAIRSTLNCVRNVRNLNEDWHFEEKKLVWLYFTCKHRSVFRLLDRRRSNRGVCFRIRDGLADTAIRSFYFDRLARCSKYCIQFQMTCEMNIVV